MNAYSLRTISKIRFWNYIFQVFQFHQNPSISSCTYCWRLLSGLVSMQNHLLNQNSCTFYFVPVKEAKIDESTQHTKSVVNFSTSRNTCISCSLKYTLQLWREGHHATQGRVQDEGVGAGPAGLAAAGPIFRRKITKILLWQWVCNLAALKRNFNLIITVPRVM